MPAKIRQEHIISFSDAFFAFSITFMAISIQIPNLPENLTQSQVIERLVGELGLRFIVYAISFFVIGTLLDFLSSNLQPYNWFSRDNSMVKPCILILHNPYSVCC